MKIITLSDHTAEQQKLEREGREQHHLVAMSAWQAAVDARAQRVLQRWGALVEATRRLRPLEAITGFFRWAAAALTNAPRPPDLARPSDKEEKWAGGQLGEQRLRACLERMLGDGWVVLAGYFNRGGEMDLLIVGPSAIVAVEVKYLNGVVHCRGQQWTRDKYDLFGGLPDTIEDDWIESEELLEEMMDKYVHLRQKARDAFEMRYKETIDPDGNRWELCSRVLARKDVIERLSVSW